jgi:hypothetical protein
LSRRLPRRLPAQILTALDEQTVVVPGTEQCGRVISGVAAQLFAVLHQRVAVPGELEAVRAPSAGYDRKRTEGKNHSAALLCLVRSEPGAPR